MREVVFLGHRINASGVWPTLDKVETLQRFKAPKSKEELKSFLGFLAFMGRFMPNLSDHTYILRKMLKKDVSFDWTGAHQDAFDKIKRLVSKESHLKYFQVERKTRLVTDASPFGLGAILMQQYGDVWMPITYASKGLTPNEQKFGQTEKEALGIVWAVERFHFYLYGIRFQILTDCKVLKLLFGPKSDPSARIQRWALRLSAYDYEIEYLPGKWNFVDALSRMIDFPCNTEVTGERVLRTVQRMRPLKPYRKTKSDTQRMRIVRCSKLKKPS